VFVTWKDRVVPFGMNFVGLQIDMGKLFIGDLAPNGVLAMIQAAGVFVRMWPHASKVSGKLGIGVHTQRDNQRDNTSRW
jgi:hypothetical protein